MSFYCYNFVFFFYFPLVTRLLTITHIEFDVFQCTVNDLVQSLTVDSNTVSKHMSRTSVRHDVILAQDTPPPRIVADDGRRAPTTAAAAVAVGEKTRRQPDSPENPNTLSNSTIICVKRFSLLFFYFFFLYRCVYTTNTDYCLRRSSFGPKHNAAQKKKRKRKNWKHGRRLYTVKINSY